MDPEEQIIFFIVVSSGFEIWVAQRDFYDPFNDATDPSYLVTSNK